MNTKISEIINFKFFDWLDKFCAANPEYNGSVQCPVTGEIVWFVKGILCNDDSEVKYWQRHFYGI